MAAGFAGWGVFQLSEHARFAAETGGASFVLALLTLLGLHAAPAWSSDFAESAIGSSLRKSAWRTMAAAVLTLGMLLASLSILPITDGIEMPGVALSVEPMVNVPAPYHHSHAGTFILTSVIQQTPIVLGEWVYGHLSSEVLLLPPQEIVPPGTTLQQQARQGFRMLDESEAAAIVVGLRLAGFRVPAVGKGVLIDSVLPDSPSQGVLQPGDIIVAFNGQPISAVGELLKQIAATLPSVTVRLQVVRNGAERDLTTSLLPPTNQGGSPRLGIAIEPAGLTYSLPIPVKIVPQKIVGGPSAGLMFALTVYNALSPVDLAGGRRIAGTGTIDPDGNVGPIGGVEEKVVAAENAGAAYFLAPAANYRDALATARRIKVVEVTTADQAIAFLRSLPQGDE